ncbi:MAG: hypothetical protein NTV34_05320, partial [Proteobacteria bacterium]|nr:hypothetical protein [Pseudomonadota bacterium]
MFLKLSIFFVLLAHASSCSTPGNAKKAEELKYDFVAGHTGEDRVIVSGDNASLTSDRNAVQEYTKTVDTINDQRQIIEGDLVGLNNCRKRNAAAKNIQLTDAPTKLDCMA